MRYRGAERGVTLIDTVFGTALMLLVFAGIVGAFQLSVDIVSNNKARAGAIALANERMEYLRSLSYSSLGVSGGIPSGTLAQTEAVSLNNISYTRRTFITYADDARDGVGSSDSNSITADYKVLKVEVLWTSGTTQRSVELVTRVSPLGVETTVPGGTLSLTVVDAQASALQNAQISILNTGANPDINLTTYSDSSGQAVFVGATTTGTYEVTITKSGYSTAQTYSASPSNPSPTPGHLAVLNNQTTSATFAIDILSSKTVVTRNKSDGTHLSGVPFTLTGAKTIGSSPVVYKYQQTHGSGGTGTTTVSNLEWDTYTLTIPSSSGYAIASACAPQPEYLGPNSSQTTILYLAPYTTHSLLVVVRSSATGAVIQDASVRVYRTGYNTTIPSDTCGQAFFSGLSATTYSIEVSASGYTTQTMSNVSVSGTTGVAVSLN